MVGLRRAFSFAGLSTFERNLENLDPWINRFVPSERRAVELKSLTQPPKEVVGVIAAVIYMTAKKGSNLKKLDISWNGGKKMMGSADAFLVMLQEFDKDNLPLENKECVRKYTGPPTSPDPHFNYDYMKSKSVAAAGLCDWVVNICTYHDIYLDVEPKRKMLQDAQAELAAANAKLTTCAIRWRCSRSSRRPLG